MRTSEVLNTAADVIEERGWTQGPGGWIGSGSLCVEGGIAAALDIDLFDARECLWACPAYQAVSVYLGRDPQPRTSPIKDALWEWNDAEERTAEQVIATLRAAAVIEAAKETADERAAVTA